MVGVTDMGGEELRSRLLAFDRAVALLHPGRSFRLVLVGGGAMVLLGCLARATSDLDVLVFPPELASLMTQFDLNGRVKAWEDHFACNIEEDSSRSTCRPRPLHASRLRSRTWSCRSFTLRGRRTCWISDVPKC